MDQQKIVWGAWVRGTWPQLVTLAGFLVAISLRFPGWFVLISAVVIVAAISQSARLAALQRSHGLHDPLLGAVLVGSGLASIALTMKWWFVEKQMTLAADTLLYLVGHTEGASDLALAWSSVLTQWGSCVIFLVVAAVWGLHDGSAD
ncbi:hypothetical protein FAZ95_07920 [Trinickia violacea]|uniref:Uncharacterized protein n=1 Tax=Trinickia violacea TaxID=2571746 RepID=A0A4P8IJW9_9BURK|nr:hypothetical protein [Trinickia violacea]QCP49112.1 hypothetical protein FAZ95_07920 [Trinickia violacea]